MQRQISVTIACKYEPFYLQKVMKIAKGPTCGSIFIVIIALCVLKMYFFYSSPVKYMREATPYVKKGSPVSEIGWETPPPESPRLSSPPVTSSPETPSPTIQHSLSLNGDRRCIPLKMCYVTRAMTTPDPENR